VTELARAATETLTGNRSGPAAGAGSSDGKPGSGAPGRVIEVRDPADDTPVTSVPVAMEADVIAAVAAARAAQPGWAATAAAQRAQAVAAAAEAVAGRAAELAALTTREMGRPEREALAGVHAGVSTLRQYAELGPVHRGRSLNGGYDATDLMVPEPRGVIAVLTPWNDPVAVACGLLGAALVTGNTVVTKPSERTPGTGALLAQIISGYLPEGVLNLLPGDGEVGAQLVRQELDVVAHVGSTRTGRHIVASCARTGAKAVLENGGSDPLLVDADTDPAWAAGQAALGAFANAGQLCVSVERIYVHQAVAEEFLRHLVTRARELRIGPGSDPGTEIGPLVDRRLRDAVHAQVTEAIQEGARLLTGGVVPDGPGSFYPPTVLADCTDEMAIMRDETFGPVAPVATVNSFEEGLRLASSSSYGLAATVLTGSMSHAQRAWRQLPVGTVKINNVFGGAPGGAAHPRQGSGQGYGYGPELLDEFTATKVVHITPLP
jgi:succinate-semialdehyde dehydrogenase/glutarate-semialdehyde dehydrogenase